MARLAGLWHRVVRDIGCHIFDPVWKGLDLQPPLRVSAEVQGSWKASAERRADTWPQGDTLPDLPGNEFIAGRELMLEWFDGDYYRPITSASSPQPTSENIRLNPRCSSARKDRC